MSLASGRLEMTEVTESYQKFKYIKQKRTETLSGYFSRFDDCITNLEATIKHALDDELKAQFFFLGMISSLQDDFKSAYYQKNFGRKLMMAQIRKVVEATPNKRGSEGNQGGNVDATIRKAISAAA